MLMMREAKRAYKIIQMCRTPGDWLYYNNRYPKQRVLKFIFTEDLGKMISRELKAEGIAHSNDCGDLRLSVPVDFKAPRPTQKEKAQARAIKQARRKRIKELEAEIAKLIPRHRSIVIYGKA